MTSTSSYWLWNIYKYQWSNWIRHNCLKNTFEKHFNFRIFFFFEGFFFSVLDMNLRNKNTVLLKVLNIMHWSLSPFLQLNNSLHIEESHRNWCNSFQLSIAYVMPWKTRSTTLWVTLHCFCHTNLRQLCDCCTAVYCQVMCRFCLKDRIYKPK